MNARRRFSALPLALALAALPACRTQDIEPTQVVIADYQAGPAADKGRVVVALSPTDDSNQTPYRVLLDDELVLDAPGDFSSPFAVRAGEEVGTGFLESGPRHFTIVAAGEAPIFEGDGQVPGGGMVRLYLYGPLNALHGLFVSTPDAASAGNEHVTVVNLMQSGQTIEVVSCTDATTCTPVSPALAPGDQFDTEVPAVITYGCPPGTIPDAICPPPSLSPEGAGIGYRLVPSSALPNPRVLPLHPADAGIPGEAMATVFVAAPVSMSDQGQLLFGFND
jgi:hypothetical protein